ncbi:unnamed protein product [Moneuplotes crassus]|uniref:Palmitoyltransferase n=1 Tax=Euplotes crassus TaxID=5936 RepID=A0AAD1XGJ2_EUPCR|nr:unnamed protein product [Moneuplotes crassus]
MTLESLFHSIPQEYNHPLRNNKRASLEEILLEFPQISEAVDKELDRIDLENCHKYDSSSEENCSDSLVRDNPEAKREKIIRDIKDIYGYKYCNICKRDKPPRAHHCRLCGHCSLNFDHHCPIIGSCIGKYNRRYFFQMSLYCLISCICCMTMILFTDLSLIQTVAGLWCGFCLIFSGLSVFSQLYLMSYNMTTIEYLKKYNWVLFKQTKSLCYNIGIGMETHLKISWFVPI